MYSCNQFWTQFYCTISLFLVQSECLVEETITNSEQTEKSTLDSESAENFQNIETNFDKEENDKSDPDSMTNEQEKINEKISEDNWDDNENDNENDNLKNDQFDNTEKLDSNNDNNSSPIDNSHGTMGA